MKHLLISIVIASSVIACLPTTVVGCAYGVICTSPECPWNRDCIHGITLLYYCGACWHNAPDVPAADSPTESTTIAVYHQVAKKALAGDFGKLTDWQHQGYTKLLYLDKPPT